MIEMFEAHFDGLGLVRVFLKTLRVLKGQARFHFIFFDLRLGQTPTWPNGHVGDWSRDNFPN